MGSHGPRARSLPFTIQQDSTLFNEPQRFSIPPCIRINIFVFLKAWPQFSLPFHGCKNLKGMLHILILKDAIAIRRVAQIVPITLSVLPLLLYLVFVLSFL